jgi:hypothetical protein
VCLFDPEQLVGLVGPFEPVFAHAQRPAADARQLLGAAQRGFAGAQGFFGGARVGDVGGHASTPSSSPSGV